MKSLLLIVIVYFSAYSVTKSLTNQQSFIVNKKSHVDPYKMIAEGESLLKEGDLVVRLNHEPLSRFIKNFNHHDKSYSHAGIVLIENGYPYVYHIVNGEGNPDEALKKDSLKQFCDPRNNKAFGVFRYQLTPNEITRLKSVIHKWYAERIRFDSKFDMTTDDRMYCSEMVSKALAIATHQRISIATTGLTTIESVGLSIYTHHSISQIRDLKLVAIDDLYTNPFCHVVKRCNY